MRYEAVADSFYPADKRQLEAFIEKAMKNANIGDIAKDAVSFVAPHAGYAYSGAVAAYTYRALEKALLARNIDTFVVIGPNHTGYGAPISVSAQDWHTPIGIARNDLELSQAIASSSKKIEIDEEAHRSEHSVEVQIPFLQKIADKRYTFICMGNQSIDSSRLLAEAIIKSAEKLNREIAVIASSDFNHYESAKVAERKDMPAIEALLNMDYIGFNDKLVESGSTACGYGPITVAAIFAKSKGAEKGYLLKYTNSGETNNDYSSVVAYASIIFA
ncbi:MAG: MEMO1 family protein [Candidatus Micrarchaeia archaeon]